MNRKLRELLSTEEYALFLQAIYDTAIQFPDIIGVLGVGTLVHSLEIPADFFTPRFNTARGLVYEKIRNPGRRRLAIRDESDLDIWICTRDVNLSPITQEKVELGAIALLSELMSSTLQWGSVHWRNKKEAIFGPHYKNPDFYSRDFIRTNGSSEPWMAHQFKSLLEKHVIERIPHFVERVNQRFHKKIPGSFFEIRAFPESLFHLRPDDTMMPNMQEDRMPFPRIANDQWISPEHSSLILYAQDEVRIYPFRNDGRVLGHRIAEYLETDGTSFTGKSYGSIVIKPDALRRGQLDIIMAKIYAGIASFNGRIVTQKRLMAVSDVDIETMYPLLTGRDLQEAKHSLVGGDMIILIIESDLLAPELFRRINSIKGPRLMDRSYERLLEGRVLDAGLRDLLPIPGEEEMYQNILPKILAKKADSTIRFTDTEYEYYAQNLVHSPDNEVELQGLFRLAGFTPK